MANNLLYALHLYKYYEVCGEIGKTLHCTGAHRRVHFKTYTGHIGFLMVAGSSPVTPPILSVMYPSWLRQATAGVGSFFYRTLTGSIPVMAVLI